MHVQTVWRRPAGVLVAGALVIASVAMARAAATTPAEALRCCGSSEALRAPEAMRAGIACAAFLALAAVLIAVRLTGRLRGPGWLVAVWNLLGLAFLAYGWYSMVWLGMTL